MGEQNRVEQQFPQLGKVKLEEGDSLDEYNLAIHEAIARPHEKQYLNEIVRLLRIHGIRLASIQFVLGVIALILAYFLVKDIYRSLL